MNNYQQSKMKRSIILSMPILFIISAPVHFLFELTGKLNIIGTFAPVNESPWEHLKLVFYPILVWWIIYYLRSRKEVGFSKEKWIVSTAVATFSAPLTIILFFYSYTGAFGVEILALDIFSAFLAIVVGQYLSYHIYKYAKPGRLVSILSLGLVIALIFMFVVFTFKAPHINLFRDRNTGNYGL